MNQEKHDLQQAYHRNTLYQFLCSEKCKLFQPNQRVVLTPGVCVSMCVWGGGYVWM
jgi:hypothetical protein